MSVRSVTARLPGDRTPSTANGSTRRGNLRVPLVVVVAVSAMALAACGAETTSDAERFCGEISTDPGSIVAPPLDDEEQLTTTLERYRELAELAPIAVEADVQSLLSSLETASTVVPDDPASVQRAVTQAYASERSAVVLRDWIRANCGVDLGPVATITPHD